MDLDYAQQLINKTREDYNNISDSFSESRSELWPELEELKKYIGKNDKILDSGCGNGRLIKLFKDKDVDYTGVDISKRLVGIAREKHGERFVVGDILNLPFPEENFDSIWLIAVLHHIPSRELRIKALREAKRVLRPGGKVILTCWNLYQFNYLRLLLKFFLRKAFVGSKLDFKDILVPWEKTNTKKYYHAFTMKELKNLFVSAGLEIEESKFLKRNNKKTNLLIVGRKQI